MARIIKHSNSYLIRVVNGKDINGKQIVENTVFIPTATTPKAIEKEVNAFAVQFEKQVKNGQYYSGEKMKFSEVEKDWYEEWAVKHLTISQSEEYDHVLKTVFIPVLGNLIISKITPLNCQNIIKKMENKGLKATTIRKRFSMLNSVFKYAYRLNIIHENPCDRCELPKLDQDDELHYFNLEQSQTFLKILDDPVTFNYSDRKRKDSKGQEYTVNHYQATRSVSMMFKVYFTIAIYSGFRREEMTALTWQDIDFEESTISINKAVAHTKEGQIIKETKTKAGNRDIILPEVCFDLLDQWKQEQKKTSAIMGEDWKGFTGGKFDQNFIFIQADGKMMDLCTPYHKFHKIINAYNRKLDHEAEAEKDPEKKALIQSKKLPVIRLHDLRHTSATLLLSENVDIETVAHRMGHSKASVTLDIYGHALQKKDETASKKLNDLFCDHPELKKDQKQEQAGLN